MVISLVTFFAIADIEIIRPARASDVCAAAADLCDGLVEPWGRMGLDKNLIDVTCFTSWGRRVGY
jgi:hypothetical protein